MSRECTYMIPDPSGWGRPAQCSKAAKVQRGEEWFCTIHDPERIKAKKAEKEAAADAERALSRANMEGAKRLLDRVRELTGAHPTGHPHTDWRTGRFTGEVVLTTAALSALLVRAEAHAPGLTGQEETP